MSNFDPTEAVTFDLPFGHVHLDGAAHRVLVPADGLLALCRAAGDEAAGRFAAAMGEAMGRRVSVRIGSGPDDRHAAVRRSSLEEVVGQLAAELALVGLGALSHETWGHAMVPVVDQSPLGAEGDAFLARVIEAALRALTGQEAGVVPIHRDGVRARFVVVAPGVAEDVGARLRGGESWGSVLVQLHPPAS